MSWELGFRDASPRVASTGQRACSSGQRSILREAQVSNLYDAHHSATFSDELLVKAPATGDLRGGHYARVAHFRSRCSHRTHNWNPGRRSPRTFADHG